MKASSRNETQILPIPPTAMLKAVHESMRDLFTRYHTLGPEAGWAKKGLFHVIQKILLLHMKIEEAVFFPAVQSMMTGVATRVVLKALRDHRQVMALLEE